MRVARDVPPDHDQEEHMNVMEAHGLRKTYESEGLRSGRCAGST